MTFLKEHHRQYLDLRDVFQNQGCPVCNLIEKYDERKTQELLAEFASPDKMKTGRMPTLCERHTRKVMNLHFQTAAAFLAERLRRHEENLRRSVREYKQYGKATKAIRLLKIFQRQVITSHAPSGDARNCSICDALMHEETRYLKTFLDSIIEFDFTRSYRLSDGLCSPHFTEALNGFYHHQNVPLLMDEQLAKVGMLQQKIQDHFKKTETKSISEQDDLSLWNSVLEFLTGRADIAFPGKTPAGGKDRQQVQLRSSQDLGEEDEKENQDPASALEDLLFEHEKLHRQYEELRKHYVEESGRAAALHYQCWKIGEDNKTLEMNYVGARARARRYKEQLDYANRKIERLEEDLKNKNASPNPGA